MPDCCINDAGLLIVAGTGGHTGSIDMIKITLKWLFKSRCLVLLCGGSIAGVAQTSLYTISLGLLITDNLCKIGRVPRFSQTTSLGCIKLYLSIDTKC